MASKTLPGLAAILGLLLAVTAGYGAGRILYWRDCADLVTFACLAGISLALAACCRRQSTVQERLAAVGLVVYVVMTAALDVLSFVHDPWTLILGVAWLLPPVVGGMVLPRWGAWLAVAGCWAIVFAGVAALACNVSHVDCGVGFFTRWIS